MTPDDQARLDDYRHMRGPTGGNLAFLLDQLTDVMALVAQHKVYCRVEKGPRAGEGTLDVEQALLLLQETKDLVQETLAEVESAGPS
jgi:hypothetical protein